MPLMAMSTARLCQKMDSSPAPMSANSRENRILQQGGAQGKAGQGRGKARQGQGRGSQVVAHHTAQGRLRACIRAG